MKNYLSKERNDIATIQNNWRATSTNRLSHVYSVGAYASSDTTSLTVDAITKEWPLLKEPIAPLLVSINKKKFKIPRFPVY